MSIVHACTILQFTEKDVYLPSLNDRPNERNSRDKKFSFLVFYSKAQTCRHLQRTWHQDLPHPPQGAVGNAGSSHECPNQTLLPWFVLIFFRNDNCFPFHCLNRITLCITKRDFFSERHIKHESWRIDHHWLYFNSQSMGFLCAKIFVCSAAVSTTWKP